MKRLICLPLLATLLSLSLAQKAEARARTCSASYTILNSETYFGTSITLGWIDLGTVRGIPRRKSKKCREKAERYLNQPGRYRDFGLTREMACSFRNGVPIRIGSYVRGLSDPGYRDVSSWLGAVCRR